MAELGGVRLTTRWVKLPTHVTQNKSEGLHNVERERERGMETHLTLGRRCCCNAPDIDLRYAGKGESYLITDSLAALGHVEVESKRRLRRHHTRVYTVVGLPCRATLAATVAVVVAACTRPLAVLKPDD